MLQFNNYSEKLQQILDEARPSEGNKYIFESLGGSFGLPETDTIKDPGTGKNITIAIVKGYTPNRNLESNRSDIPQFGRANFVKERADRNEIIGGHSDMDDVFDFLFLCRWNKDNIDKPWHIKPDGNRYKFKSSDLERELEAKNLRRKQISKAQVDILDMKEQQLRKIAKGLYPDYNEVSVNVLTERLLALSEKDPAKATGKEEDEALKTSVFVKQLEKAGIVKRLPRKWVFAHDESKICSLQPGDDMESGFVRFLNNDDNKKVADELARLLKEAEPKQGFLDKVFK